MKIRFSFAGEKVDVHPSRLEDARELDRNKDGYLSHRELLGYQGIRVNAKEGPGLDKEAVVHETKCHLARIPNPHVSAYRSYADVTRELKELEKKYPGLCKRVALGKTEQGRTIWGLKISERVDRSSHKPGVVITGCHHAREWMTVEVPMFSAQELLEAYAAGDPAAKKRLQDAEIWFVPMVNPDGYEHSRRFENLWRKNRRPVEAVVDGENVRSVGVDNNRNYYHEDFPELYRRKNDTPGTTKDDNEPGADDPREEIYRGPRGASEKENQALLKLELGRKNIRGVIDHHSYGECILYPHGYTKRPARDRKLLVEIAEKMNQAAGGKMKVQQSATFTTGTGGAEDVQYAHGILNYTFEINGCFQPSPEHIQPTCERIHQANMTFIDEIVDGAHEGRLPERR